MKESIFAAHAAKDVTQKITKDYEKLQNENSGILKAPKIIGILGVVDMMFFGICTAGALFSKNTGTYGNVFLPLYYK